MGTALQAPRSRRAQARPAARHGPARGRVQQRGAAAGVPNFLRPPTPGNSVPTPASPANFPQPPTLSAPDAQCEQRLEEAENWAQGSFGPEESTGGGLGGFTVWYFPFSGPGVLLIRQGVAVEFKDTLVENGGVITPHPDLPDSPSLIAFAVSMGFMPPLLRYAMLARYQWTPAEQTPWVADLESTVEDAWGFEHEFFLNQPQWDWIGAEVAISLNIGARARSAGDHMDLEVFRTPPEETLRDFDISHGLSPGTAADPRDQSMRLASTTTRTDDLLRESVFFGHNSAALNTAARQELDKFINEFDGAVDDPAHQEITVELIAHTSASGEADYNKGLAERRARAVEDYLHNHGFHFVSTRVSQEHRGEAEASSTDPNRAEDRRVDLVVDGGERMNVAIHEWGHAFGMDDEYGTVGEKPGHHDMAAAMTDANGNRLPGAVREHNAGVMSFGNDVRPRHYATFHNALETITSKHPWSLGPPREKDASQCQLPAGDFPSPDAETRPA